MQENRPANRFGYGARWVQNARLFCARGRSQAVRVKLQPLGMGGAVPGLACGRCRASRRGPGAPHTAGPVPKVRTFVQRLSSVLGVTFSRHCSRQRRKGGQQALSVSLVVKKRPTNRDAAEKSSVPAESNMPSFGAVGSAPPPALHNNNRGGEGAARQAPKVSSVVKPNPSFVFVRVNDGGSRKRRGRT